MKNIKRALSVMLVLGSLLSLVACVEPQTGNNDYAASTEDANVWSAVASHQILATQSEDYYADVRLDKIYVDAAINEYETAQIIISAKKDLKFKVSVSDLVHTQDSTAVIDKENITIYTQKYITVTTNWHGNGAPTGSYPDALLPQANAVEYEQNIVKAGENGASVLCFYIPKDAKPGNYTGKATVDLGKETVDVDVALKVYNVTLSDKTTSKAIFTVNTGMMRTYELDITDEMYASYMQFMIDHRVACAVENVSALKEEGDTNERLWAKSCYYWYEKGLATLQLSPGMTSSNGYSCLNMEVMQKQLIELAKISLEKNVNLCALTALYDFPIDEPFACRYTGDQIQHLIDIFDQAIDKTVAQLETMEGFDSKIGKEIIESVRKTPHVITDYYGTEFRYSPVPTYADGTKLSYAGQNVVLCPKVNDYNTAAQRAQYDLTVPNEKWWYNCNEPSFPYPSYHTDDTPVSAMCFGWMMADYGITGNLYWAVNYSYLNNKPVEDPYSLVYTGTGANGEGTIMYPGKPYGVYGPVGSIRMKAVLDGNEDYELIKDFFRVCEEKGLDGRDIYNRITASFYSGSKVTGNSLAFEEARKIFLTIAEAAASNVELIISSIQENIAQDGARTFVFAVSVADGAKLYRDGELLTADEDGVYRITCNLENEKNYLNLKGEKDGEEAQISIYLGGMQKVYHASDFAENHFTTNAQNIVLTNGVYQFSFDGSQTGKIAFNDILIKDIGANTQNYIVEIENPGNEVSFKLYATYESFGRVEFRSGTLVSGTNKLELDNFSAVNWERNGKLTSLEIVIEGAQSIGISSIVIFGK